MEDAAFNQSMASLPVQDGSQDELQPSEEEGEESDNEERA